MSYAYIPTGESRQPKKGEWFGLDDGILQAVCDFKSGRQRTIYRRIDMAVLTGLVEATTYYFLANDISCELHSFAKCGQCAACHVVAALAAAREAGITLGPTDG